jgi:mannose-6-phosphate isomerase-like protein (cupin superfamily)
MSTVDIGPEEMQTRVVRFKELSPRPKPSGDDVPPEVTDFMTADRNYSYMAPAMESVSVIQKFAAMTGGDAGNAISVSVAVCSPGRGPALHAHFNTVEAFFCLSSSFAIEWGPEGEHSLVLEPWDFIHVPKGVVRTFRNVGDVEGALLVIIQGNRGDFDDVAYPEYVARQITEKFGAEALEKMTSGGRTFGAVIS